MTSNLQDILSTPPIPNPPKEWRAGMEWNGKEGEVTSRPIPSGQSPDTQEILRENGLDPNEVEVYDHLFKVWEAQTPNGIEKLSSHRFKVRVQPEQVNIDDLVEVISDWPLAENRGQGHSENTTVFAVGDLQIGKANGDGTEGIVARFMSSLEAAVVRYCQSPTDEVLIAFLGDCIEGVVSQRGKVIGDSDLGLTDQLRVLRHLMTQAILRFEDAGAKVTVLSAPGNHDEAFRSPVNAKPTDSFAVDSLRAVDEAFTLAGRDSITFLYPKESELTVAAEVGGMKFLCAHGHQWNTGKHYQWWKGQSFSQQTGHDAQWLLAGHRHHLFIDTESDRFFLQVPALEQRSDWWRNKTGQVGNPGAVYLEIEPSGAPRVIALVQ